MRDHSARRPRDLALWPSPVFVAMAREGSSRRYQFSAALGAAGGSMFSHSLCFWAGDSRLVIETSEGMPSPPRRPGAPGQLPPGSGLRPGKLKAERESWCVPLVLVLVGQQVPSSCC